MAALPVGTMPGRETIQMRNNVVESPGISNEGRVQGYLVKEVRKIRGEKSCFYFNINNDI